MTVTSRRERPVATALERRDTMPREARLMLFSAVFGSLPVGLLLVFFPLYLHDLGMKSFLIGSIFTIAGIGSSLLLMVIGPLADRFGRRRFLIAGTALPAVGFLIFSLSTNPGWLVAASMLGGVGFSGGFGGGLVTATFNPILAGTVEPRKRTMVIAWSEGAWGLAMGTGTLLAGVPSLVSGAHLMGRLAADRAVFVFCLAVTIMATLVLLPVHERHAVHQPDEGHADAPARQRPPWSLIARLAIFFTLQGMGIGLVVQLLPLWVALRFHTTAAAIAPWFAAAQIAGLPLLALVPALARRVGVAGLVVLVAGGSTLILTGVPLAPALPVAGVLFVMRSALVTMQWPAQLSFLQGAAHPHLRGTVTSASLGCWSVATALMPSLTGYLLDRQMMVLPIWLGIGCYGLAAAWFWLTLRHTPLPEEATQAAQAPGVVAVGAQAG
jgi:MFS family permease